MIVQKLCTSYAEVVQKLCRSCADVDMTFLTKLFCKEVVCQNATDLKAVICCLTKS